MGSRHKLNIDLWQDAVRLARADIQKRGFATSGLNTDDALILTCLEVQRQHLPRYPRFIAKVKEFLCPPQYNATLYQIEHNIKSGGNLNPYLSHRNANRGNRDALLFHWNIRHLHLSAKPRRLPSKLPRTAIAPRQFVQGTKDLLYCWIDTQAVYFIGVFTHDDFDNPDLIAILHENWPELLRPYRLYGVQGPVLSLDQVKNLRDKHCNSAIAMSDGVTYGFLGGGVTGSGHNIRDRYYTDYLHHWATATQRVIKDWLPSELLRTQRRYSVDIPNPVIIELCVFGSNLFRLKTETEGLGCLVVSVCPDGESKVHLILFPNRNLALKDIQWQRLEVLLPERDWYLLYRGCSYHSPREILNGIIWFLQSGASWEHLPCRHYPPWNVCAKFFQDWVLEGVLQRILYVVDDL